MTRNNVIIQCFMILVKLPLHISEFCQHQNSGKGPNIFKISHIHFMTYCIDIICLFLRNVYPWKCEFYAIHKRSLDDKDLLLQTFHLFVELPAFTMMSFIFCSTVMSSMGWVGENLSTMVAMKRMVLKRYFYNGINDKDFCYYDNSAQYYLTIVLSTIANYCHCNYSA